MSVSDNQLHMALLGKPQFERNGQSLRSLTSVKGQALLAYLAVTGQPHSRSALAGLLWSEMPEEVARTNLRVTLSQLRKAVGDVVIATRHSVEFNRHSNTWLDVDVLENAANSETKLAAAADLYRGDFLDDFYVPEAEIFEEWVLVERERLRQLALSVLGTAADIALEQRHFATGISMARRLLSIEPWHEGGHRQLMKLLAAEGQVGLALAQYETCRRLLAEELGVEPSVETKALVEAIRNGEWRISQAVQVETIVPIPSVEPGGLPPHNLLAATTSFVGRQIEQTKIAELLIESDCRLVTIAGPGGMGKTRLAVTVAFDQLTLGTPFRHGVYFVPLGSVSSTSSTITSDSNLLVSAIGIALGISFSGKTPLKTQLLHAVREMKMLLVLDNFEHLTDYARQVIDILEQAPGLKVIVTSRVRLNLYEECVFDLWGLPYPTAVDDTARLEAIDSIQLFVQRAQRVYGEFDLAREMPHVVRICRLLEGMPLGLELAATWVRTLPCRDIAQEIEQNLDFLATTIRNVPERQRSMRAVFDYSWRSLTTEEQGVFKKLSVFAGGFTLDAVRQVADASTRTLADLVDRSLVRQETSGRYSLQELLRQYALEKLMADPAKYELTKDQHCMYFGDYVQQRDFDKQRDFKKSLIDRDVEIDNIRLAWTWAVEQGRAQALLKIHLGLGELYELSGRYGEGVELFQQAAARLYPIYQERKAMFSTGYIEIGEVYSHLLAWQGRFAIRLGRLEQAQELTYESLIVAGESDQGTQWSRAFPLSLLGMIDWHFGHYDTSRQYLEEALAISQRTDGLFVTHLSLTHLGLIEADLGNYDIAWQRHEEAIIIGQSLGMHNFLGIQYNFLGRLAYTLKDYAQAQQYLEKGIQACRATHHICDIAFGLTYLGLVKWRTGQPEKGNLLCLESLDIFNDIGERCGQALALGHLGQIAWALEDYQQSKHYFLEALKTSLDIKTKPQTLYALLGLARHLARAGQSHQDAQLLAYIAHHPASEHITRERARRLLAENHGQSESQPTATAPNDQQIEKIVREILPGGVG